MKAIIFDAGPIINFSINGMLDVLEKLKNSFDGKFLITGAVKKEVIDYPINVPRFELGALRVQALVNRGVFEPPLSFKIEDEIIRKESFRLMNVANHYIFSRDTWINIMSEGEASCLALSNELIKQKVDNIIAIDERTTRILSEKPGNLKKLIEDRLHTVVKAELSNLHEFENFRFIRSTELVYIAFKKGLLDIEGKKALEAALYATKFKGSSVTYEEIEELKKL